MSSSTAAATSLPVASDLIGATASGAMRVVTLNRPKALNALNLEMVRAMTPLVKGWAADDAVALIVMTGEGSKAFCAGGDVVAVVKSGRGGDDGGAMARDFFREEYILDHILATMEETPYVAIMDGITMGGGVGLSDPADYRVATEKTLFAMPETGIGLFPDVGGSFFLPKLPGSFGMYLALTGARLKGEDVVKAGVATHYVPSENVDELIAALATVDKKNDYTAVAAIMDKFDSSTDAPASFAEHVAVIDKCFSQDSVPAIIAALEAEGTEWATKQVATLGRMSPTSLAITHKQLTLGATMPLKECFTMEYRITQGCLRADDFYEGIRAVLIDKDQNPQWSPATLADVTDAIVDDHFKSLGDQDLIL